VILSLLATAKANGLDPAKDIVKNNIPN